MSTLSVTILSAVALLAGSPALAAQTGTAYCFGNGCPCGNDDIDAGCGNAGHDGDPGTGSLLEVQSGSAVALLDDLVLRVSGLGAGLPGIVVMGSATTSTPFGDGLLCVAAGGTGLFRFPVRSANEDGWYTEAAIVAQSLGKPGGDVLPGDTRYFQAWYRDPAGPCGSGYNVSNALEVTFELPLGPLPAQLAGIPLTKYPHFQYTTSILSGNRVYFALDTSVVPLPIGTTGDLYIVASKTVTEWRNDPSLVDLAGGPAPLTVAAGGIQANTHLVDTGTLNGISGADVGVGYDMVFDVDRDGMLGVGDLVDGFSKAAGFYVVRDTSAVGPYATAEIDHNAGGYLLKKIYYPTNIDSLGEVPLIVVSHGNGHSYLWYGHIGHHLASYGYVVMSHRNNTVPGPDAASLTTLSNTDHLLENLDTIGGGVLLGHVDSHTIAFIGHSRGGEGVVRAYDRMVDGTSVPVNFTLDDVRLISSIAPTNFLGVNSANPHDVDYHLWVGSADADVSGVPSNSVAQCFQLLERAEGRRASITLQGAGHAVFHNGGGGWVASGPCLIGPDKVHPIMKGYLLPLIRHFIDGDPASEEFLWRQYDTFRPQGAPPSSDPCVVVHMEFKDDPAGDDFTLDDYQTATGTGLSSSNGAVSFDVQDIVELRLDDLNTSFTWTASDPPNGMTRGSTNDSTRGVIFNYDQPSFYELEIAAPHRDLTDNDWLSFRVCQGTRHPNTTFELGDVTFRVALRDGNGRTSTIDVDAFGGGVGEPYQRTGAGTGAGWGNEFETFRVRLEDFRANGSGLFLHDVRALRLEFGDGFGSSQARLGFDDFVFTQK